MSIGIVGYGLFGKALARLFGYDASTTDVRIYDKFLEGMNTAQC